ncbi:hypothetical protein Vretimale_1449, partial [Volvox reticuliferus]
AGAWSGESVTHNAAADTAPEALPEIVADGADRELVPGCCCACCSSARNLTGTGWKSSQLAAPKARLTSPGGGGAVTVVASLSPASPCFGARSIAEVTLFQKTSRHDMGPAVGPAAAAAAAALPWLSFWVVVARAAELGGSWEPEEDRELTRARSLCSMAAAAVDVDLGGGAGGDDRRVLYHTIPGPPVLTTRVSGTNGCTSSPALAMSMSVDWRTSG